MADRWTCRVGREVGAVPDPPVGASHADGSDATTGVGSEGQHVIRYVDSAGWTWEVCELADRPPAAPAAPAASAADAGREPARPTDRRDAVALLPSLADRRAPRAALADAPPDPLAPFEPPFGAPFDAPGELYFFSRVGARKLRDYPPTWTQLSRTGLEALCDRAQDLGARRTA